jgi:hypothetical protein
LLNLLHAAVDENTPRYLELLVINFLATTLKLLTELTTKIIRYLDQGHWSFKFSYQGDEIFFTVRKKLYPAWQGMQYMRDIMEGRIIFKNMLTTDMHTLSGLLCKNF